MPVWCWPRDPKHRAAVDIPSCCVRNLKEPAERKETRERLKGGDGGGKEERRETRVALRSVHLVTGPNTLGWRLGNFFKLFLWGSNEKLKLYEDSKNKSRQARSRRAHLIGGSIMITLNTNAPVVEKSSSQGFLDIPMLFGCAATVSENLFKCPAFANPIPSQSSRALCAACTRPANASCANRMCKKDCVVRKGGCHLSDHKVYHLSNAFQFEKARPGEKEILYNCFTVIFWKKLSEDPVLQPRVLAVAYLRVCVPSLCHKNDGYLLLRARNLDSDDCVDLDAFEKLALGSRPYVRGTGKLLNGHIDIISPGDVVGEEARVARRKRQREDDIVAMPIKKRRLLPPLLSPFSPPWWLTPEALYPVHAHSKAPVTPESRARSGSPPITISSPR
ncbi:hypothetical protein BDN70DRAFT_901643 [Pholiota conissans]|uniref:Uncharacterized protein n=1 Tax=Pholiota conissans TaxID=109636 RepID=A0A9P6CSH7_9AGAR|nr:hypothetical protein BDN70DRAFT_901643 [Pholiota conissans]